MTAILADRNRATGAGTWADVGGTFAASPPLSNLGTMQIPSPNAEFTGTSAEFSFAALDAAAAAETFSVEVLGLMGHNLPAGALIEWTKSDGTLIAARTWRAFGNRPPNSMIILPAAVALDTIHCKISGVASGTYRIGAVFAGRVGLRECPESGWPVNNDDNSAVSSVDGTDWTFARTRRRKMPVRMRLLTKRSAFGIPLPGAAVAVPATWTTDNSTSAAGGVYTFSAVTGTLLEQTGVLTVSEPHRVVVKLTQDAANAGTVTANVGGDGAQALQPGENSIIGDATTGTLTFTANSAFSGTLEVTAIEQLAESLSAEDLQSRLDESGTHAPVIYMPRIDSQQSIDALAIYGRLEAGGSITHAGGAYHDAEFRITEMRG